MAAGMPCHTFGKYEREEQSASLIATISAADCDKLEVITVPAFVKEA